jgi:hypothetical protein
MYTFGTIQPTDHTIDTYGAYANVQWEVVSSSLGTVIVSPQNISELSGSIIISRASNQNRDQINIDTGTYEYVLHASVLHNFYGPIQFSLSGSTVLTASAYTPADNLFVVSIGQQLYGEYIKPNTFTLSIHPLSASIYDDGDGNLFVTSSTGTDLVGNIFYTHGIAVITHDTGSSVTSISENGIKLVSGSKTFLQYDSSMTYEQHQINVVIKPEEFTLSLFNPTILRTTYVDGPVTQSFLESGVSPREENRWLVGSLMRTGIIKPYITSIGLYNEEHQLLAIAKISTPIQRTFDTNQIFIIRFDTE